MFSHETVTRDWANKWFENERSVLGAQDTMAYLSLANLVGPGIWVIFVAGLLWGDITWRWDVAVAGLVLHAAMVLAFFRAGKRLGAAEVRREEQRKELLREVEVSAFDAKLTTIDGRNIIVFSTAD